MSGGSLDYLYSKEPEELFNHLSKIEDVEDECRKHNYEDIARDCRRLIEYIKSAYIRIEVLSKQLKDVFHDEQIKIKIIKNEMLKQMEPSIIDSIKITECEELTNPATTTYRGTFHFLQFSDCNKIGKTSGFGGLS